MLLGNCYARMWVSSSSCVLKSPRMIVNLGMERKTGDQVPKSWVNKEVTRMLQSVGGKEKLKILQLNLMGQRKEVFFFLLDGRS